MPLDRPTTVTIGSRPLALRWTKRAHYRLDSLGQARLRIEDTKDGSGFAFMCQHVWAMLDRETDRRRYPAPEDVAQILDADDESTLHTLWRAVWLEAYGVDIDKKAATPAPDSEAGAPADPTPPTPSPSTGPAK